MRVLQLVESMVTSLKLTNQTQEKTQRIIQSIIESNNQTDASLTEVWVVISVQ